MDTVTCVEQDDGTKSIEYIEPEDFYPGYVKYQDKGVIFRTLEKIREILYRILL